MDNKKLANRKLNDQELEGVAGAAIELCRLSYRKDISTGKKFSQDELMNTFKEKFTGADSNFKKDLKF